MEMQGNKIKGIIYLIAVIILMACAWYTWQTIYDKPLVKPDPITQEIQAIKTEVANDRVVIKEVIRYERQEVITHVAALSDDAVADEWNERLRRYRANKTVSSGDATN